MSDVFRRVERIGLTFPGVAIETKYDGSPVLKVAGRFFAGLARHHSAEPASLVVRSDPEQRPFLLEEAPEIYYVTEYYRRHPVVLVRLRRIDAVTLRDVLAMSWRLTNAKAGSRRTPSRGSALAPRLT